MIPSSDRTGGYSIHITQNIGIISNTSSQGELSYRASSLHVAFMTAQRVTLTIPWCREKWNYRKRESTKQRLCANHALTSARLQCTESGEVHNCAWEISPQPLCRKSRKKIGLLQGLQSKDQPCPTSARRKQICRLFEGHTETITPAMKKREKC